MEELFKAIYHFWKSDACGPVREIVTGGLWLDTAEEGTTKPYGVYVIGKDVTEITSESIITVTPVTFIFEVDDGDCAKAVRIMDAFTLAFDAFDKSDSCRQLIGPSGFTATITHCNRQSKTGPMRMPEKVYAVEADYEFRIVTTKNEQ